MPYYRIVGDIPRKRHTQFRRPDGGLYAEELMGEEGFFSDSSLLYHVHAPTAIVKSEGVSTPAGQQHTEANHPLAPRHFRTRDLPSGGDLVLGRQRPGRQRRRAHVVRVRRRGLPAVPRLGG